MDFSGHVNFLEWLTPVATTRFSRSINPIFDILWPKRKGLYLQSLPVTVLRSGVLPVVQTGAVETIIAHHPKIVT